MKYTSEGHKITSFGLSRFFIASGQTPQNVLFAGKSDFQIVY